MQPHIVRVEMNYQHVSENPSSPPCCSSLDGKKLNWQRENEPKAVKGEVHKHSKWRKTSKLTDKENLRIAACQRRLPLTCAHASSKKDRRGKSLYEPVLSRINPGEEGEWKSWRMLVIHRWQRGAHYCQKWVMRRVRMRKAYGVGGCVSDASRMAR